MWSRQWTAVAGKTDGSRQPSSAGLRAATASAIIAMMRTLSWKHARLALALLVVAAAAAPVQADHGRRAREVGPPQGFAPHSTAERRISIEQAIARVQRETGGRVLAARDQGDRYRIKVLTRDGEVRVVYVDAVTGKMQ